jgi:thymidylate synthase ThyX
VLLNKINVLDKGFVAPLVVSGDGRLLQDIQDHYFKTKTNLKLLELCNVSLVIKCPLFVQLNLSQYGLSIITTPSDNVEAYIPDLSMIDGESLEDKQEIARYIEITTEALLLNHKGLMMDGGSKFTAQLLTPITVYNELIVTGKLNNWLNFLRQKKLPKELDLYRSAVHNVISTGWRNLDQLVKG